MHGIDFELLTITRILVAVAMGSAIGLERELTNKFAGLRTHILVCLGSCIFTILSIYAFPTAVNSTNPQAFGDPARIAAQVLTGIGFIGGGTVLRHGSSVYGLTTAATLWMSASIGMACGAGMLDIAIISTLVSVAVLVFVRIFELKVLVNNIKNTKKLKITILCNEDESEQLHAYIIDNYDNIQEISKKRSDKKENLTKIVAVIDINARKPIKELYRNFKTLKGLESISIQDGNE
jgi:putative Mg2+ transporter-C (MgtC) family protein